MGEAAKISLKAIGKQDTFLLSKDPDESFFNYTTNRNHSNFRKYHRNKPVVKPGNAEASWPFNKTIKVEFNPRNMGDLLSNMYLSITMPAITDGNYADQLGRHILKSVTMYVDDIEVEKIHDDWGILYDELYLEVSEKVANRFLINRNLGFDDAPTSASVARYDSDLVIPLHFFFSRKFASDEYSSNKPNRPYFPVCAIHKQKIEFEFDFHQQTFFTDTTDTVTLPSFNLITEEITISPEERNFSFKDYYDMLISYFDKERFNFIFEPGRLIAADAGILVSKVLYTKISEGKKFIIIDAGMNDMMRPALYDAQHEILTSKLNDSDHNIETEIVGPICESSDKFMRTTKFANIEEGDNVVIKNVGAYGSTMSSNYNARPFIEELLIDKEEIQIIRKKQSFEDFIKNEL